MVGEQQLSVSSISHTRTGSEMIGKHEHVMRRKETLSANGRSLIHPNSPQGARFDFPQRLLTTAPGMQDQTNTCSLDHVDHAR